MATGKSSFLLYADLIHTLEKMPDDKAGLLFKHILRYVNDLNPETDDLVVQLTFEPIKQQLKRDLKKYEGTIHAKSEGGQWGNLKKWHPDIYKQAKEKDLSLSDAMRLVSDAMRSDAIASIADSVNDSVNDTVNDTVNKNKKDTPTREEFVQYGLGILGNDAGYKSPLEAKFETWMQDGWKDGHGKPIKNWKTKLQNVVPFLKPLRLVPVEQNNQPKRRELS